MRIIKYKTKLTDDKKVILEKEVSVNRPDIDKVMNSPERVIKVAKGFLRIHEDTEEYMYILCMNTKLELTSILEISHGSVNSSFVGAREVFQKALLANATSIILIHNHPSGDSKPSREDIEVTKKLIEAGNILGVQVLDHIIVGNDCVSLKEKGDI